MSKKNSSSSAVNTGNIGATFSYVVNAFDCNFAIFMHSSANANCTSGPDDAILDQNS